MSLPVLGWRETIGLPEFGLPAIPAKIDTGARTSALHATNIELVEDGGISLVRFRIDLGHGDETPVLRSASRLAPADHQFERAGGGTADRHYQARTRRAKPSRPNSA